MSFIVRASDPSDVAARRASAAVLIAVAAALDVIGNSRALGGRKAI